MNSNKTFALIASLSLVASAAMGQYSIDWFKVAGGGGSSTGSVYSVTGTLGQPDSGGPMIGGSYSLTGGFWSLIAAVQSSAAPKLTITRSGNSVIVFWPSPSTGFVLQQNANLANPAGWSSYAGAISDNGTSRSVNISPPVGNQFFRLKQ